ncbi:glycerophosphoryl diester phosphodiesterase membrane domain-containing protein [Faecalimicrobium sp. JNUCC 81]
MYKKILNKFILLMRYNFSTLILFELFHKGLALIIVLPFIRYIVNSSLKNSGMIYLSTDNIVKILTNPISIILMFLSIVVLAFYMFFEFTSVVICFDKSSKLDNIGLFELIKISIQKSIKIFYPKNILLIVFVLLIIPLTNLTLTSGFISSIKIPEYILDYIVSNEILSIIYIISMLILYVLVIRWIFSIHEITLKTDSFKEARKKSNNLTKGKKIKILIYSVRLFILIAIISFIIYYAAIIFIGLWTKYFTDASHLKQIFISRSIMFRNYAIFISSIVSFTISIGLISSFYYEYSEVEFYKYSRKINKKLRDKSILKIIIIVLLIHMESRAFSINSNRLYNTEFFYNTTAVSHRVGGTFAPENTLVAFNEAFNSQAEYAEIDVQETKDGELIIIHDSNFKRTTGIDKNVWDVNYKEVKNYDAGSYFDYSYKGEKIPTLEDVIKYTRGKIKLVIEIKIHGHEKGDIEKTVIDLIKKYQIENQCIIASMDKNVLKKVKKLDSNITTCYLTAIAYGNFYNWDYVNIYGIESTFVNQEIIDNIHKAGKKVFAWTINNQDIMEKMIDLDVDSIITDNPYFLQDTIYWKQNGFISKIANKIFD